jgi:DNA-binding PadR family transcriptional regulator
MSDDATPIARDLTRCSLELLVLSLLVDGPRTGYAIRRKLTEATGFDPGPGTLHPLLGRALRAGWLEIVRQETAGRRRKWYGLTDPGRTRLRRLAAQWHGATARVQAQVLPALRRATADAG